MKYRLSSVNMLTTKVLLNDQSMLRWHFNWMSACLEDKYTSKKAQSRDKDAGEKCSPES